MGWKLLLLQERYSIMGLITPAGNLAGFLGGRRYVIGMLQRILMQEKGDLGLLDTMKITMFASSEGISQRQP